MKLTMSQDVSGEKHYHLTITQDDLLKAKFHRWDHLLFEDCKDSASIADHLLALELLARRVEETEAKAATS